MRCPPAPPTTPRVRRSLPHGASTANGASPLSAPVPLAGACAHPAYCCLLSRGEHRDGDTWGARLPELADRGLAPRAGIAGSAGGPREGQHEAPPGAPCRGDVSRAPRGRQARGRHLDNRACGAVSRRVGPERRRARLAWREGRKGRSPALGLARATRAGPHAAALADEARALLGWSRRGALAVAGPGHATRQALCGRAVAQLRQREGRRARRTGPVRRLLANQRGEPRAFAAPLDQGAGRPALRRQVSGQLAREALAVVQTGEARPRRWRRGKGSRRRLGGECARLRPEAEEPAAGAARASSVTESLNSRLRGCLFLRERLGPGCLAPLQFHLNRRRSPRSAHARRADKGPREPLAGEPHGRWLEPLGHQRFRRH